MICISIAQESRRFAMVDMLNASRQCDLLELRLDRFEKDVKLPELLARKPKPVILSCRRPKDGGHWEGTEEERLTLLRQCIIAKADYVEIEHDVAHLIRPFPPTKRVISYTSLQETPSNLADIYNECCSKNPDAVKLTTLARTPEEAWPLVQILGKASIPTVVVGLGKPGIMLTILGKKLGAPWTYAALEQGMETYPAQPTVQALNSIYHHPSIDAHTRFIGVMGFGPIETANVGMLNAAFAHLNLKARCLPLAVGNMALFRKVMDATRLAGVVVDEEHRHAIIDIATESEAVVQHAEAADLLIRKGDQWQAFNTIGRAAIAALEGLLRSRNAVEKPLQGRMTMIAGTNPTARMMAFGVGKRGAVPIIAGRDREAAQQLAQLANCRHVNWEALYTTTHDVLVVCSEERQAMKTRTKTMETAGLHPGYLRPHIAVLDLTSMGRKSEFLGQAQERGCPVVLPRQVLLDQVEMQVKLLTGNSAPREVLETAMNEVLGEAD